MLDFVDFVILIQLYFHFFVPSCCCFVGSMSSGFSDSLFIKFPVMSDPRVKKQAVNGPVVNAA